MDGDTVGTDVHSVGVDRGRRRMEFGNGSGVGGSCLHALLLLSILWLYCLI